MKYTLITGASSGIGEAFARRLAREGHNLFLVARSEEKLKSLCAELEAQHKVTAKYLAADLIDVDSDIAVFEESERLGLEIDWLINNAGFGSMGDFAELDLERELEMIELNITAVVALTHHFLKGMRRRKRGTIINVSSGAAFQPIPFFATYAATKAFVSSFSEAIAEENRPFGIRILALCPGTTDTGFFEAAGIADPIKVKGVQTPEQVVEAGLRGLERGQHKTVSGWTNYFIASVVNLLPNSLITRAMAKPLRKRYQSDAEVPAK
ncbi:MAG: SDR family NAD(P)-dependent oxidoreductase [Pyrinomonadaceae bacterium]